MNDRIKELAEQAEQYAHEQNDKHGVRFKTEYDRKFAELIVKECADISDASFHDGSAGYTAILKHFGVE